MVHPNSMFSQLLSVISRNEFKSAVKELKTDKHSKGFDSWDHFVSMMFCQLASAKSLREISYGLQSCVGKLNHLGMEQAPKRSTLSYANKHRSWELFERMFYQILGTCSSMAPGKKKKFRFKNELLSLDASNIEMCLSIFDWAKYQTTKGAIKLHTLLDHNGYLPRYVRITDGKTHEVNIAHEIELPKGSIVAMDRGYTDYSLFEKWDKKSIYFVIRLKSNAQYELVRQEKCPKHRNIMKNQIIRLKGVSSELRMIEVFDKENLEWIQIITNKTDFGASTISAIYKDRWGIEIFFRTLKQNFKIKTFVGTSANAVMIQIWTALISMLLVQYLKFLSKFHWSMSNLVVLFRMNMFTHKNLWNWIDNPFETPPAPSGPTQMFLPGFEIGQHNSK